MTDARRPDAQRTDPPTANTPAAATRDDLAAFGALVLADEALQARLGGIVVPDAYVAAVLDIAAEHGLMLDADTVRAAGRPDPLGLNRFAPSPVTLDRWPVRGWLPARGVPTGGAPAFDWAWFGPDPLTAPFYEDSVRRFATRPFSQMFRTRTMMAAMVNDGRAAAAPPPAGFIHHMSRCGSTLVAQMLGADPHHVVLSEPEPLDAVVRWAMETAAPLDERVAALRAIVAALARDRTGETRRVFFKLDSWHTKALPLFQAAFPDTPWVFVYRDPVEVLVSQSRHRGIHTVAGLLPTSLFDIADAAGMQGDRYAALVLADACGAVVDHWPAGGGLLVNYDEMPDAVIDRIAPHFGFTPDSAQRAAMRDAATRDAKAPDQVFVADALAKRQAATPEIAAGARLIDPVYARLEAIRTM